VASSPDVLSDSASVTIGPPIATLVLQKTASPTAIQEPSGTVTYTYAVTNTSESGDIQLNTLNDDRLGDVTLMQGTISSTNCAMPQTVAPQGGEYVCEVTATVSGESGDEVVNIGTVTGTDIVGDPVVATDRAVVDVTGDTAAMAVTKTATPNQLPTPGGEVEFTITVLNESATDALTLTELTDDVFGDLNGQGNCLLPQTIAPLATYSCVFEGDVAGAATDVHANIVRANAESDDGTPLSEFDRATVSFFVLENIPTAAWWAFAITALGLGWLGSRRLRVSR
jgi:hypothetical protein